MGTIYGSKGEKTVIFLRFMANPKTLKPFKKGKDERRNLGGRPKGTPNRSTIARYVLEMKGKPPEQILRNLEMMYPEFFKKKNKKWTNEFLMTIRLAQKAIIQGDVSSYEAIMDSAYGKPAQKIEEQVEFDFEDEE